jgi:hypothetical protein
MEAYVIKLLCKINNLILARLINFLSTTMAQVKGHRKFIKIEAEKLMKKKQNQIKTVSIFNKPKPNQSTILFGCLFVSCRDEE